MGVHGLWRLIEPSGKPVPVEMLENKVLAVDVSIWLHQAIKGFQDSKGGSVPNAHLLGIYHRVCKLLYFQIRPVFIFDGGVPALKKETIAKRNNLKSKNLSETYSIHKQLLNTLLKHSAVNKVISEKAMANMEDCIQKSPEKLPKDAKVDDIYKLPLGQLESSESLSEEEEEDERVRYARRWDLHTIDEKSTQFRSLPADVRHDILTELKETRKQSSWGRIHELPTQSGDFSIYQMKRLLKRHSVQVSLEETEKEMGGHALSLGELEALLSDHGVIISNDRIGGRIASSEGTRYLLIKDVKKALEEAAKQKETDTEMVEITEEEPDSKTETETMKLNEEETDLKSQALEFEYERDLRAAIQLSLQDLPSTSKTKHDLREEPKKSSKLNDFDDVRSNKSLKIAVHENEDDVTSEITENNSNADQIDENRKNKVQDKFTEKIINQENSAQEPPINANTDTFVSTPIISEAQETNPDSEIAKGNKASLGISVELMSDSDSDNFIEIDEESASIDKESENALEIIIEPKENLEDDIFADIFSSEPDSSDVQQKKARQEETVDKEKCLEQIGPTTTRKSIDKEEMEFEIVTTPTEKDGDSHVEELNPKNMPGKIEGPPLTVGQLKEMKDDLLKEKHKLITEKSGKERLANNITDQMYQDAQELLQLFGVPYIIAPMEAEAQCAFLEQINLTDGTITDDSDIWLFGGTTVYKNFFNQSKHVMEFRSESIQHFYKLSRYEMILLALLVGSDYTTGVQDVGPVTALEILAAFPMKKKDAEDALINDYHIVVSGLQEFQKWFKQGKVAGPGRTALRNKLKNIALGDNFPSLQVVQAYMEPKVETSRENFSWGKPDLTALVEFAREKFGWSKTKSEEILKPVLKRAEETATQTKITNYFKLKHKIDAGEAETKMSKRVKSAVNKISKQHEGLAPDEDVEALKQVKRSSKKKVKQIECELETEMEKEAEKARLAQEKVAIKAKAFTNLHKAEKIPQREQDKANLFRRKMKAIEAFRKSKQGPGFVKKRQKAARASKEDAELSESSSD